MYYLTDMSAEELQRNFEAADEHLKQVFSKYPQKDMDSCDCDEHPRPDPNHDQIFNSYLGKAMYTWGDEKDFKHYIPRLFSFVFLEGAGDVYILSCKLNYVKNWLPEETQAILSWYSAYSQYKYISDLKALIKKSRLNVQAWLEDRVQMLSCNFPFSIFFEGEFEELVPFFSPELLEKFTELLDMWPHDETDFVAYAYCLTNYLIFSNSEYGIFEKKVAKWISKNDKILEELFWKTEDPRLQKLFSDTQPPNYPYPR
jgi:hypothetical protein